MEVGKQEKKRKGSGVEISDMIPYRIKMPHKDEDGFHIGMEYSFPWSNTECLFEEGEDNGGAQFMKPHEIVIPDSDIRILFDFSSGGPLTNEFKKAFHSDGGFTRQAIVNHIKDTLDKIASCEHSLEPEEDQLREEADQRNQDWVTLKE